MHHVLGLGMNGRLRVVRYICRNKLIIPVAQLAKLEDFFKSGFVELL